MPQISTGSVGFGETLLGAIQAVPGIIQAFRNPLAAPGGAPLLGIGNPLPGLQVPGTGVTIRSPVTGTAGVAETSALALMRSPFRPTMAGAASQTFVMANPVSGKPTWFGPRGRPLLWSRDLAVCKRVKKIGARARRVSGGRR